MAKDSIATRLNRWLDEVPRTRLFRGARTSSAFRSCGIAGTYAALIATVGTGLRAGVSLTILAVLAAVCMASFFVLALLRRTLTGREQLVLLEHLWFALLAVAGVSWGLGEPVLADLDVISIGLCVFMAFGRLGCLMVGCCHGMPASVGIAYGPATVPDGFSRYLVDVRLFPVPALEAAGWLAIGLAGFVWVPASSPGLVTVWVLAAYAVLRFGLEGLRGDARPTLLGLTQARWMATLQAVAALLLAEAVAGRTVSGRPAAMAVALIVLVAIAAAVGRGFSRRPHLLDASREVRALVRSLGAHRRILPEVERTTAGVSVGVSWEPGRAGHALRVSCMLPVDVRDLRLLCDLAATALPELDVVGAEVDPETLLHVQVPPSIPARSPDRIASRSVADALYGAVLRRYQRRPQDASARPPAELLADLPTELTEPPHAQNCGFGNIRVYADDTDGAQRVSREPGR